MNQLPPAPDAPDKSPTDGSSAESAAPRPAVSRRLWAGMAVVAVVAAVGVGAVGALPAFPDQSTTAAGRVAGAASPDVPAAAAPAETPDPAGPDAVAAVALDPDGEAPAVVAAAPPASEPEPAPELPAPPPEPAPAAESVAAPAPAPAAEPVPAPAPVPEPAPVPAPAPEPAPVYVAPAPAVRTIYVAGAGGQSMVDACIGPIHYTPNDGYSLFITEHDFCGGWARFSGIGVGETVSIPGYGTYTATARGQVPNPGTTNDVIAVFGGFPRAVLQTCIPGTSQMLLIALN